MDPLFTLPTAPAPPFGRATNFELRKILLETPLNPASVTGTHVFQFANMANEWWVPSKSYLRLRLAFEKIDSTGRAVAPAFEDMIAPVMNPAAHLFSRIEYFLGGTNKISSITDFIPQIDTLKYRTSRSTSHLDTFGEMSNFMQPDFRTRQARISCGFDPDKRPLTALSRQPLTLYNNAGVYQSGRQQLGASHIGSASRNLIRQTHQSFEEELQLPTRIWDPSNFPRALNGILPDLLPFRASLDRSAGASRIMAIPVLVSSPLSPPNHYILMFEPRTFNTSDGIVPLEYNTRSFTSLVGAVNDQSVVDMFGAERSQKYEGLSAHFMYLNLLTAIGISEEELKSHVGGVLQFRNLQPGSVLTGTDGKTGKTNTTCSAKITDIYYGPQYSKIRTRVDNKVGGDTSIHYRTGGGFGPPAPGSPAATAPAIAVQGTSEVMIDQMEKQLNDPATTIGYDAQVAYVPMGYILYIPGLNTSTTSNVASDAFVSNAFSTGTNVTAIGDGKTRGDPNSDITRSNVDLSKRLKLHHLFGGINTPAYGRTTTIANNAAAPLANFPGPDFDDRPCYLPANCLCEIHVFAPKDSKYSASRAPTSLSNSFELCWTPPLGIFGIGHALPPCTHKLEFVVNNDFQQRLIEFGDLQPWQVADAAARIVPYGTPIFNNPDLYGKFRVQIVDLSFFAAMATGDRKDEASFVLDFPERRMVMYQIPASQMDQATAYTFNIDPSSTDVTVAFQTAFAGKGTTSMSKFHVPTVARSWGAETALDRFYVNFNGQNRPREENESKLVRYFPPSIGSTLTNYVPQGNLRPIVDANNGTFNADFKFNVQSPYVDNVIVSTSAKPLQYFTQRYFETMMNSSMMFSSGGCESFHTWLERGAFYHWVWPRDGADLSTTFQVFVKFFKASQNYQIESFSKVNPDDEMISAWPPKLGPLNQDNLVNICIFDRKLHAWRVQIQNGQVISCRDSSSFTPDGLARPRLT